MRSLRILVFSASFGAGHIMAAEALIQAFKDIKPSVEIIHEDYMGLYNNVVNRMIKSSYISIIKCAPKLWGTFYHSTKNLTYDSIFQRLINKIGRKQLTDYVYSLQPDLIICTYPTISGLLAELKSSGELNIPLVTVITDYTTHCQWIHPGVDMYIVGSSQVSDGLVERGINPKSIQLTGIPVSPNFDRILNHQEVRKDLGLKNDRFTFLIMGGAYGVLSNIKWMCKYIAAADAPIQGIVVCGKDQRLYNSLDSVLEEARNPIVRFNFVDNIDVLMTASDAIITKAGGLTVSEALTKHLPMIIYKPIPGQEENNANYIEAIGAGKIAYTQQEMQSIVKELIENRDITDKMRLSSAHAFPGHSAERAVKAILNLIYELPSALPAGANTAV
ncbi:UDP-N-acetylglucosamine:LPS N-acetylglucosamine transferase [Desulfosporosinus orientis DSM 765]|uniref:UDP-N-acetylglucosamine:LPS N-acetylglucosamine transferase n=1 Tax=Desulfosporosinus orientis (strain ATCC 19365 / DSM 765 / NCIMB 8382 / VKM B-1628 / Singapore I) TaxID=768706 RepID=G7WFG7_DESOD|nr:UDP-N-acetylglucosamine--LPS N-acetylglucosamine transferase [Desulfosporosinus orientis]AET68410.1 UDP-N-acetylglucosamine:LPS N-acetylglucosamine transferase [Desulfosporosinus orientis DSM 765]